MKIGIVIQARLGSTRLPRKVFMPLPTGETVLERIVKACKGTRFPVIVTTPDMEIVTASMMYGVKSILYDGKRNIKQEIIQAARELKIGHIIRITADCPLIKAEDIEAAANAYNGEYLYHGPDGRDVEIFPLDQFEKMTVANDSPCRGFHHNGLSLDTQADYEKICSILKQET